MKPDTEIVRIKEIYKKDGFKIYCLFSNEESRYIDFEELFKQWNVQEDDIEYQLLDLNELHNVNLTNGTLSWNNITVSLLDEKRKEKQFPYQIDPIVLYQNSKFDEDRIFENLGLLLKRERIKSGLTRKELAIKSGISEVYITRIENERSNIELLIIRDILRNGFGKKIKINVE